MAGRDRIVLLIVLRGHLGSLADRRDRFKFGSAELSFKNGLVEGLKNIIDAPPPPLPKAEPELPFDQPKEPKDHVQLGRHRTTDAF